MIRLGVSAPYFEDLAVGDEFGAPAVTLTTGYAAQYQALTGDRLRLSLDHHESVRVTGNQSPLAHPMLVTNVSIGQSTWVSQLTKANLFYRSLVLHRPVHLGDTLYTITRVVGLRQSTPRPDRAATGLVALEIVTQNQDGQTLLHYWRCPMLPCRDSGANSAHRDDLDALGSEITNANIDAAVPNQWSTADLRQRWRSPGANQIEAGARLGLEARDTVTAAPDLVRLTLNLALAHLDASQSHHGARLVYGGHTISLAFAQVTRAIPNILTMLAWERCDHVGPVFEGDVIRSDIHVLERRAVSTGAILKLHVCSYATREASQTESFVLDWIVWILTL